MVPSEATVNDSGFTVGSITSHFLDGFKMGSRVLGKFAKKMKRYSGFASRVVTGTGRGSFT